MILYSLVVAYFFGPRCSLLLHFDATQQHEQFKLVASYMNVSIFFT